MTCVADGRRALRAGRPREDYPEGNRWVKRLAME